MLLWILLIILLIVIAFKVWKHGVPTLDLGSSKNAMNDVVGRGESELELFLVRHAKADDGGENISDVGREQAAKTGKYLKTRLSDTKNVVIYSSPAPISVATAEVIREELALSDPIKQDDRLAELDRGDGGKDFSAEPELAQKLKTANLEFAEKYPDPLDQHKHSDEYFKLLQKTFGGENVNARLQKLRKFMDEIRSTAGHVIVITHSGIIGILAPDLVSVSQKGSYLTGDTRNGRNCTITYYDEKDGKPILLVPTNSMHLADK
jgi:broad specificity phosphatase PhoE